MSEKRGIASSELKPEGAMGHLVKGEADFLKGMKGRVGEVIILLTTFFALHGSAEAKGPNAHEELMKMLPQFREVDFDPKVGPSPEQAAEQILNLREQTKLALETFGGEAAWANYNLDINGQKIAEETITDKMPHKGQVFVFGSRQFRGGYGSLDEEIADPSQSYQSENGIVEIGPGNKFIPSGEETEIMGYGKDQEHALANALTSAAQDSRSNFLFGGGKGKLPASLGGTSNLDFAAYFQLGNIEFQEVEGSYRVVVKITPGSVEVVNEPNE